MLKEMTAAFIWFVKPVVCLKTCCLTSVSPSKINIFIRIKLKALYEILYLLYNQKALLSSQTTFLEISVPIQKQQS